MSEVELTWFEAWAVHHGTVFGLSESETPTLLSWEGALGATAEELYSATAALATNPRQFGESEARFAGKLTLHLTLLVSQIREQRSAAVSQQADPRDTLGTCTLCSSSGWVIVPHPNGLADGEWVPQRKARGGASYYTVAVLCSCALGRWMGQHRKSAGLTLQQYDRLNPRWPIQVARREREEAAYREAVLPVATSPEQQRYQQSLDGFIAGLQARMKGVG